MFRYFCVQLFFLSWKKNVFARDWRVQKKNKIREKSKIKHENSLNENKLKSCRKILTCRSRYCAFCFRLVFVAVTQPFNSFKRILNHFPSTNNKVKRQHQHNFLFFFFLFIKWTIEVLWAFFIPFHDWKQSFFASSSSLGSRRLFACLPAPWPLLHSFAVFNVMPKIIDCLQIFHVISKIKSSNYRLRYSIHTFQFHEGSEWKRKLHRNEF